MSSSYTLQVPAFMDGDYLANPLLPDPKAENLLDLMAVLQEEPEPKPYRIQSFENLCQEFDAHHIPTLESVCSIYSPDYNYLLRVQQVAEHVLSVVFDHQDSRTLLLPSDSYIAVNNAFYAFSGAEDSVCVFEMAVNPSNPKEVFHTTNLHLPNLNLALQVNSSLLYDNLVFLNPPYGHPSREDGKQVRLINIVAQYFVEGNSYGLHAAVDNKAEAAHIKSHSPLGCTWQLGLQTHLVDELYRYYGSDSDFDGTLWPNSIPPFEPLGSPPQGITVPKKLVAARNMY